MNEKNSMSFHKYFKNNDLSKCKPAAEPEDILRNEPHIKADIRCADGGGVRMRYNKNSRNVESWEVYSEINFYIPPSEKSNARKLSKFIKQKAIDHFEVDHDLDCCEPCDIPAVVDNDYYMFSALPEDSLAVRELRIFSHSHSKDNEKHTITTASRVITSYIPYSRHKHTCIAQWFMDCAQHIISRIARELIAQTDISCTNMTISS